LLVAGVPPSVATWVSACATAAWSTTGHGINRDSASRKASRAGGRRERGNLIRASMRYKWPVRAYVFLARSSRRAHILRT
jgi:hypothetical protein